MKTFRSLLMHRTRNFSGPLFQRMGGGYVKGKGDFHGTAHAGVFAELADWEPIPGSPAGVLSQPDVYIRVAGEGGVTDGIVTTGTYHFDPTKWYRVTVEMDIDPLKQNLDGDGGQFNIEGHGHHWDMMNLMLGWGIAGEIDPDPQPVQTLIIPPGTAEENAKIRVVSMGIAGDPIEIVMIRIEQFDHDPNIIAPAFHTPLQSLIHLAVGEPLPEFHIKLHFTNNPTSYSLVNFPDGTSVDNAGVITGTPTTVQVKNDAHVVATNAAGSAQSNAIRFEIVAAGVVVPPTYNGNIEPITAVVGEAFTLDVHHHWGLGGPVASYSLQNAPAGMVISDLGVITWPNPAKNANDIGINSYAMVGDDWKGSPHNISSGLVATAAADQIGIDGLPNTATKSTDSNVTESQNTMYVLGIPPVPVTSVIYRLWVKKTTDKTCFISFFGGGMGDWPEVHLNTNTGAHARSDAEVYDVHASGDWWVVTIEQTTYVYDATDAIFIGAYPALGDIASFPARNVSSIGSAIFGNMEICFNKTLAEIKDLPPQYIPVIPTTVTGTNAGGDAVSNTFGVSAIALGPELVTNVSCDGTDMYQEWICQEGVTINNNIVSVTAVGNSKGYVTWLKTLTQIGKTYRFSLRIINIDSGDFVLSVDGAYLKTANSGFVGTLSAIATVGIRQSVFFTSGHSGVMSFTDISIREVLP